MILINIISFLVLLNIQFSLTWTLSWVYIAFKKTPSAYMTHSMSPGNLAVHSLLAKPISEYNVNYMV